MFVARRIAESVDVPVTVDAGAGYGWTAEELAEILIGISAAGCNIEDSDHTHGGLLDIDARADYLRELRAAADRSGVPDLRAIITDVGAPVNAGLDLQNDSLAALRAIGVARVSVGPQIHSRALDHVRSELGPLLDGQE